MAGKRQYQTTSSLEPGDLYDYARSRPTRRLPLRAGADMWQPTVTDDWPEKVPVTEAELDVFEAHFAELLDELFGPRH